MPLDGDPPLFTAVSSSARQLYILLRCISFAPKAQVQISPEGLRFSTSSLSAMEGLAFLDKALFTTFTYNAPAIPQDSGSLVSEPAEPEHPIFEINLPALLETLQIFGVTTSSSLAGRADPYTSLPSHTSTAFAPQTLGMPGLCRLSYVSTGSPLQVVLQEAGITTTCALTTYTPQETEDIPFSRAHLALKIITRSSHLHDAISELCLTNPDTLTLTASSTTAPHFSLSASGPLGSASVAFSSLSSASASASASSSFRLTHKTEHKPSQSGILETFQLSSSTRRFTQSYNFALVKNALKAMAVATKVSIRGDDQGVLSLQFMIEVDAGAEPAVSFVDIRFVPLITGEGEEEEDEEKEEGGGGRSDEDETGDSETD